MGREIRRVPANWEHPTTDEYNDGRDQPMYDELLEDAMEVWLKTFDRIRAGDLTEDEKGWYPAGLAGWALDEPMPDPRYYRPYKDEEAVWYQVYETVSEGTPVTPPFETQEELITYLVENGDFWDQKRGNQGPTRKQAESFVKHEMSVPSFIVNTHTGTILSGIEQCGED